MGAVGAGRLRPRARHGIPRISSPAPRSASPTGSAPVRAMAGGRVAAGGGATPGEAGGEAAAGAGGAAAVLGEPAGGGAGGGPEGGRGAGPGGRRGPSHAVAGERSPPPGALSP